MNKLMTKELIEEILEYSKTNCISEKEAAKHFKVNSKMLHYYKNKFNIPLNPIGNGPFTARIKRKNDVNDNFFSEPNKINCYYAGFFAADGCVDKNRRVCSLIISSKDQDWLELYKQNVGFTGPILKSLAKGKFPTSNVSFTSQQIVNDLSSNFNITPSKSLSLVHPNITDKELIDHFICGYIDGDGSIMICKNNSKQKRLVINIVGTHDMCEWIKNRFCEIVGKNIGSIQNLHSTSELTYTYTITDKSAREIFEHYYKLDCPKLVRKWAPEKYEYCINYKKRNPVCRRKGVNAFNLKGEFVKHFETLKEAEEFTGVCFTTISTLCKENNNQHAGNGYMFSRDDKARMEPYHPSKSINKKEWLK